MLALRRFLRSALLACSAGLLLCSSPLPAAQPAPPPASSTGTTKPAHAAPAYSAEELAAHERARASLLGVGALHKSKKRENCADCHGERITLSDNQVTENKECIGCHGDYKEMQAESDKKIKNKHLNPHSSHLGPEVACTACHAGHQESKAYCLHCHTNFTMPMPGNTPAKR